MEFITLLKANLKRHKGGLAGIFILLFLVSLSLVTVLTIWENSNSYIPAEMRRAGFGDLTAWISGIPNPDLLSNEISALDTVERTESQKIIYSNSVLRKQESDSEGQLILYNPKENRYRFFTDSLSGYQPQPEKIQPGEVYVSPSMISMFGAEIGDEITFPIARAGKNLILKIAGWYEDPFMGSSMIGMKGFLIDGSSYNAALAIPQNAGIDALARNGAMIHIFAADPEENSSLFSAEINEKTSLSSYTGFVHSKTAISGFMLVLQNAFSGFLFAFAAVLLLAAMAMLGYQIQSAIQQDFVNMGILKTVGFTSKRLCMIQLLQYLIAIICGMLLGLAAAVPMSQNVRFATLTTTGILIPAKLPFSLCLLSFGSILSVLIGFILWKLRNVRHVTPMGAIRGETEKQLFSVKRLPAIRAKGLYASLALRQLFTSKRRYIGACLVAILLVFFASLAGRMDAWLGTDGKGMMDAFNPADHDLGIQSFGELTQETFEKTIRSYSEIIDVYVLAMPNVTVNGVDFTANVIDQPERFHLIEGLPAMADNEIVITEFVAADFGVGIGDSLTIGADLGNDAYRISGIYSCANDMGQNIGMSREGYLKIGSDFPNLWCWHYFLADPSQKAAITAELENAYGGDIHIHENTWPGLYGIISAMQALILVLYSMSVLFILIVTIMTGGRILTAEQKDFGIYKAIGFSSASLRMTFAFRFGIMAVTGSVLGTVLAAVFTDPLVSFFMKLAGISNFASAPDLGTVLFPGAIITLLFLCFGWLAARKIEKIDLTILVSE